MTTQILNPRSVGRTMIMLLLAVLLAATSSILPAQAVGGTITNVSLSPTTVSQGSSTSLSFDFSIDGIGSTVTLTAPSGFDVSSFDGKTVKNGSGIDIATIAVSGQTLTVTSLLDAAEGSVSQGITFTDAISAGQTRDTVWDVDGVPTTITVIGVNPDTTLPAWFNPGKYSTNNGWADDGKYRIGWHINTQAGPYSTLTVVDNAGPGLIPDCGSLVSGDIYVRGWDESTASDSWAATVSTSQYTINSCSETPGGSFSITFNVDVPAAQTGAANNGGRKVFYLSMNYNTYVDESTIVPGAVWTNQFVATAGSGVVLDKTGTASLTSLANGKRAVTVTKHVSAVDSKTYADTAFDLRLQCTGGSTTVDETLSLKNGDSSRVLVPLNSQCWVTEADSQGAQVSIVDGFGNTVSASQPLAATLTATGPLAITVTNTFTPGTVSWSKVDGSGAALAGSGWTLSGPDGFVREFAAGEASSWSVGDLPWGEYTLTESTVPEGYSGADAVSFTVDAQHLEVDLGAIANTLIPVTPGATSGDLTSGTTQAAGLAQTGESSLWLTAAVISMLLGAALIGANVVARRRS